MILVKDDQIGNRLYITCHLAYSKLFQLNSGVRFCLLNVVLSRLAVVV